MKVKGISLIRQAVVLSGFAIMSTSVVAQVIVPTKLSGRWTSPDGAQSQAISTNIDPATSKGTLTVWASKPACTIHGAAITVTLDGEKLILKVDPSYVNSCRSDVSVVLIKKSGSDDYEGELHQKGLVYDILQVKMSP